MIGWFGKARQDGVYVPAMDGPLHANMRLDQAPALATLPGASDMAASNGQIFLSSGNRVMRLHGGTLQPYRSFDAPVTAIAATGNCLVVAEAGRGLHWCSDTEDAVVALPDHDADCVTAMTPLADGSVAYCVGSGGNGALQWRRDLLQLGRTGLVRSVSRTGEVQTLATGLGWPGGILALPDERLIVAESWAHRLVDLGSGTAVLDDLPGYPGRMNLSPSGSIALAIFAPRRPQFEFLLSERQFCTDMLASLPEEDWVAPSLTRDRTRPGTPIMQGEIRQMGVMKPWAPTASYGLALRLDRHLTPVESWHSRADGLRHGIVSVGWQGERLLALSAATGEVLDVGGVA